jgi:transposase InsO family protein
MDQRMIVLEGRGFSRVKYDVEMAKRGILHEMDEYL